MRLSKASAYGVLACVYVAAHPPSAPVQGRAIAEAHDLPPEYLLKILQQLVRARILESETGRRGGFTFQKRPIDVTLLDIVEAIDGPLDSGSSSVETVVGMDAVRAHMESLLAGITARTRELLRSSTLADLLARFHATSEGKGS